MRIFIGGSKMLKALTPCMIRALEWVCERDYEVLVGDCFGADKLVQEYLHEHRYNKVKVYASGQRVRCNEGGYPVVSVTAAGKSGFEFYRQKDIAMSLAADHALMFWDGVSKGTRCNIEDMERQEKFTAVICYNTNKSKNQD